MYVYIIQYIYILRYSCKKRNTKKIPTRRCCIWPIDRYWSVILRAHITSIVLRWQICVLYWTCVDMRRMAWIPDIQLLIEKGKKEGKPWKIVVRSSSNAFDESRVFSIDARTRGTNGRMRRNLIKKKKKGKYITILKVSQMEWNVQ